MTYQIDRRRFLLGGTALTLGVGLARSVSAADAAHLRLEFWGSQGRADRTYKSTAIYKEKTGVDIQGQFFGWGDYWPKLATETAGGNGPDVEQMDYSYIVEYSTRKAILPLDEFVGSTLKIDDFDKDQVDSGMVDGKFYGVSLGSNSAAMMINTAMWKEAGVDMPDRNTTWDEYARITAEVTKANIRGGVRGTTDSSGFTTVFDNWLRQRGKGMYAPGGKLGFDADDLAEWLQMWADMRASGACVTPDEQALWTGTIATDPMSRGKAATCFNNSNQLVGYQQINKDPIGINNYPRFGKDGKGGHYRKASMFFSVGGDCKDPKAAAEFINFFVNDPASAKVLGVERGVPASASVRQALTPSLDALDQMVVAYVGGLGDLAGPVPPAPPPHSGEIGDAFTTMSQQVGFDQISVKDASTQFIEQGAAILARKT